MTITNGSKWLLGGLLVAALTVVTRPFWARTPELKVQFNGNGLSSLQYNGEEYLADGHVRINTVTFRSAKGVESHADVNGSLTIAPNKATYSYSWGQIGVEYISIRNGLDLVVTTTNRSDAPIESVSYELLNLKFPRPPLEYDGVTPLLGHNIETPTLLPLTQRNARLVLVNTDVSRPLLVGFPWSLDKPANLVFPLRVNTARDPIYPDSLPYIDRPIQPGCSDTYHLSLRFSLPDTPVKTTGADVFRNFASAYPYRLHWEDRRPIGLLFAAQQSPGWPSNPRGWLLDPKIDVKSPKGVEDFHHRLLAWADNSVVVLKNLNSQGMITWDIEGEEFPQPTSYVGDPRAAARIAPETAGVMDEYFKRFTSAGLRVGVCIRPSHFVLSADGKHASQQDAKDPAEVLIQKIRYAKDRWGATLFYIDSNGTPAKPMEVSILQKVAAAFPDVLLIPEHKSLAYYSVTAPYAELRLGVVSSPEDAQSAYPRAFSFIYTADGQIEKHFPQLQAAVRRGDSMLFRGWFNEPANQQVKALYTK